MVGDCMLVKVLDKIKEIIGIEKFDDTKILIDSHDELPVKIALEIVAMMTANFMYNYSQKKHCFLSKHCKNL